MPSLELGTDLMDALQPTDGQKRQCTAKSKQSGVRCKRLPIPGGAVCVMHGGKIPNVRAKALQRLAAMVDPALDELIRLVRKGKQENVRMRAVENVLDRNGLRPPPVVTGGDSGDFTLEELLVTYRRISASGGAPRDGGE